ncbi:DUF1983 domain-containing protein [Salmonella enterica subsp. enterica serovar Glostrup]|nr:DUF1983 domain-containing protein [Salmonella enterica subsp. enterica serovar Glostrup]
MISAITVKQKYCLGRYQAKAKWDTPRVVKGVRFVVRLTIRNGKDDDPARLVTTATTSETEYAFHELPLGDYTLTVRAINGFGQQGEPSSVTFSIQAPEAPSTIELTPGYFRITVTPHQTVYDASVQYEFWYSATQMTTGADIQSKAQYLGTGSFWIEDNLKPLHDAWFYVRSVNLVGKSAFAEACGQPSRDARGYLEFFKGLITESYLGEELLKKFDLMKDNASKLKQFSREWKDANDRWNAMWGVKIEQTRDGRRYVAGLGLSMEDAPDGKASQFLLAADRIAFINPANGNETPGFVMQDDQIIINEALVKYLSATTIIAPTITSGGNPPAFSLTQDGRLSARNVDVSGVINAYSGTLSNVHILENCRIEGKLSANQIEGDIVKAYLLNGSSVYLSPQPFTRAIYVAGGYYLSSPGSASTYGSTDRTVFTVNGVAQPVYGAGRATGNRTGLFGYYTLPANQAVTIDVYTWHEQRHYDHRINEPYLLLVFKT